MDAEVSIVERLKKLRDWQIEQQQRLLKQQHVQRQMLNHEQIRMYKALGIPVDDIHNNLILTDNPSCKEKANESNTEFIYEDDTNSNINDTDVTTEMNTLIDSNIDKLERTSSFSERNMNCNKSLNFEEEQFLESIEPVIKLSGNKHSNKSKLTINDIERDVQDLNNISTSSVEITPQKRRIEIEPLLIDGIEPLPPDEPIKQHIRIDDMPVPSPKKDFQTLLEERLKDSQITFNTEHDDKQKNKIKRPFLKKGQGLARFNVKYTPKKACACNTQSSFKDNKSNAVKKGNVSKPTKDVGKSVTIDKKISRLNLKNVPPPRKKGTVNLDSSLTNVSSSFDHGQVNKRVAELSSSDLDAKTQRELEEVRIFELLEEKAENSSFCSTSSAVVAFLQQSTPFKISKQFNTVNNSVSNVIEENNDCKASPRKQKPFNRQLTLQQTTCLKKVDEDQSRSNGIQDQQLQHCIRSFWDSTSNMNDNNGDNLKILQSSSRTDMYIMSPKSKINDQTPLQNPTSYEFDDSADGNKVDVSLHVRFSEYNEYKTIGLTDTSTISDESSTSKNFNDEKNWSDCPTAESSDTEVSSTEVKELKSSDSADQSSDTEQERNRTPMVIGNKKFNRDIRNDIKETNTSTCVHSKQVVEEKEEDGNNFEETEETIYKSELLKNRLLELEQEIDIFRKENIALSLQRKKLQEDHHRLHKEIKEREDAMNENKRKIEACLQEERKKLIREKVALETRLRDSQEKAQQNKLERQLVQSLRQELESLKDEFYNKESRWNAIQSRQKSQMRILRTENQKLKEELQHLQNAKKCNSKSTKAMGSVSNTRALHRINKQLTNRAKETIKNDPCLEDDDKIIKTMMDAIHPKSDSKKLEYETFDNVCNKESNTKSNTKVISQQSLENVIKKRNLYDSLLHDAISTATETQNASNPSDLNVVITKTDQIQHQKEEERSTIASLNINDNCNSSLYLNYIREDENVKTCQHDSNASKMSEKDRYVKRDCAAYNESSSKPPEDNPMLSHQSKSVINEQNIKHVQYENGNIEFLYPNGNVKKIFPNEGVTKMIYYNGDIRETVKDGKVKYFYSSTQTWHTTMPDGLEILEFPNGQIERRSQGGTVEISFPDGSIQIVHSDGSEKWALPDGTVAETFTDGRKIVTLPNGQREVHTKSHKRREYPDGTVKLVYPDGLQETRYSNGRTRLKDKDGNLLMDSYQ